jgi:hypothetical protein
MRLQASQAHHHPLSRYVVHPPLRRAAPAPRSLQQAVDIDAQSGLKFVRGFAAVELGDEAAVLNEHGRGQTGDGQRPGTCGLLSMSSRPTVRPPDVSAASRSTSGIVRRHGPHQVAVNTSSVGMVESRTSARNRASITEAPVRLSFARVRAKLSARSGSSRTGEHRELMAQEQVLEHGLCDIGVG